MTTTSHTDTDRLYHDLFVTALEGGIGYWSTCSTYRWAKPGTGEEDLDTFTATIHPDDDCRDDDVLDTLWVNKAIIARGVALIRGGSTQYNMAGYPTSLRTRLHAAIRDNDEADFDADDADVVVQVGLFGEVRFG